MDGDAIYNLLLIIYNYKSNLNDIAELAMQSILKSGKVSIQMVSKILCLLCENQKITQEFYTQVETFLIKNIFLIPLEDLINVTECVLEYHPNIIFINKICEVID